MDLELNLPVSPAICIKPKSVDDLILELSANYSQIISRDELRKHKKLNWGNYGIGDRWANKKYNYSVITCKTQKLYSENIDDVINDDILQIFLNKQKYPSGIIGIFVHSKRTFVINRPISPLISKQIKKHNCVVCGSTSNIICDHKNDMYNDKFVLILNTQQIEDFQSLCNHCNL